MFTLVCQGVWSVHPKLSQNPTKLLGAPRGPTHRICNSEYNWYNQYFSGPTTWATFMVGKSFPKIDTTFVLDIIFAARK